jgi:uncharacterized protein YecT (DUF1311 family)
LKTAVDFLRRINRRVDKFFFVLNRSDIWDRSELREALEHQSNVLKQECGIPNPRVLPLSSTFEEHDQEWKERFRSFKRELHVFMKSERDLVICAELARALDEAIARAQGMLISQHRLAENELAVRYKTRLPDSEQLVETLARELGAAVEEKRRYLLDGYPAFQRDKCTQLYARLCNCIEAAPDKESLAQFVPNQLRGEFKASAEALNSYLSDPLNACFRTCQELMVSKVRELFHGIRFVEEQRFFRRTETWVALAIGTAAVGWAATRAWSFEFGAAIGCAAAFAWLWFEWLYFQHVNESRFAAPPLLTLPEALTRYDQIATGAQLQSYIRLQAFSEFEQTLSDGGNAIGRGSVNMVKLGSTFGHPAIGLAAFGVGLAISAIGHISSWTVGAVRKTWDALFGASLQELKNEMLQKTREVYDEFERNSREGGAELIGMTSMAVSFALANNLKEVVQRYKYTLDRLLQRQGSLLEHLERKRRELRSDITAFNGLRVRAAETVQMLRVAMGNAPSLAPSPAVQMPSLNQPVLTPRRQAPVPGARLPMEQAPNSINQKRRWYLGPHIWVATSLLVLMAAWTCLPMFSPAPLQQANKRGTPQASLKQIPAVGGPSSPTPAPDLNGVVDDPVLKAIEPVLKTDENQFCSQSLSSDCRAQFLRQCEYKSVPLNGEGTTGLIITEKATVLCGSGGCPVRLLLDRGSGYEKVFEEIGTQDDITYSSATTNGFFNLITRNGKLDYSTYVWDGSRYVSNPVPAPGPPSSTPSDLQSATNDEAGVRALLAQWAMSFKAKDVQQHVNCYASELEIYYLQRNVSQAFVESNMVHTFDAIFMIRRLDLTDVNISFLGTADAIVTFTMSWDITLASGKPFAGSEIVELKLTLLDGSWRIKSEEKVVGMGPVTDGLDQLVNIGQHGPTANQGVTPAPQTQEGWRKFSKRPVPGMEGTGNTQTITTTPRFGQTPGIKPSFDCTKARTPTELLICRDDDLASLERSMVSAYNQAMEQRSMEQRNILRREQVQWFKEYAQTCDAARLEGERKDCVTRYLTIRTGELTALAH